MSEYVVLIGVSKANPSPDDIVETRTVVTVKSRERAGEIARALYSGSITTIENLKAQGWVLE